MRLVATDGDLVLGAGNYPGVEAIRVAKDTDLVTINGLTVDSGGVVSAPLDAFGADISLATNTLTPTNKVHNWTGTGLLKTLTVPAWAKPGDVIRLIIKSATPTVDTSQNIGKASTLVVNTHIDYLWDGTKWWPSY